MAKSYGGLYEKVISYENLFEAYQLSRKNKKNRMDVVAYHNNYLDNLTNLKNQLDNGEWEPSLYKEFVVYNEVKRRNIEAPMFKDRIVQHAIHKILEPLYEKKFIDDSYSCRKGKGTHAAVNRLKTFLIKTKTLWGKVYVLKCDISKFFPSIDHFILLKILSKTIREKKLLDLIMKASINPNKQHIGIPIGALTSQLFANVYMNPLDHYIKETLRCRFYLRYADDFLILSNNKQMLYCLLDKIEYFINYVLNLKLNPKTTIFPITQGIDFCGYRLWIDFSLPRKRVVKAGKRRIIIALKKYEKNIISKQTMIAIWNSFTSYLSHSNSFKILYYFKNFLFLVFNSFIYEKCVI